MYANGRGVIKDPVEAHKWFNVAGASGDEDARENLAILEKDMTREQKAEATKLAREFFEQLTKTK
jgi:TPR repeat protein